MFARKCLGLLLVFATLAHAGPEPEPEPENSTKAVLKKLQGKWSLVKASYRGQPVQKKIDGVTMEIEKETLVIKDTRDERFAMKIDGKKKPFEIDLTMNKGPKQSIPGIFKLEKDELTICVGEPGKTRPTTFDEKTTRMLVFKRKK